MPLGYSFINYFDNSKYCNEYAFKIISNSKYFDKNDLELMTSISKIFIDKYNLYPPPDQHPLSFQCAKLISPHICIGPDGNIHKCHILRDKEYIIGNINDSIDKIIQRCIDRISDIKIPDICIDCEVFPICIGGCRAFSSNLYSDINREFCFKDMVKAFIKQRICKYENI